MDPRLAGSAGRDAALLQQLEEQHAELEYLREQRRDKDTAISFLKTKITSLQNRGGGGGLPAQPQQHGPIEDALQAELRIEDLEQRLAHAHQELEQHYQQQQLLNGHASHGGDLQLLRIQLREREEEVISLRDALEHRVMEAQDTADRHAAEFADLQEQLLAREAQLQALGVSLQSLQQQRNEDARSSEDSLQHHIERNRRLSATLQQTGEEAERLRSLLRREQQETARLEEELSRQQVVSSCAVEMMHQAMGPEEIAGAAWNPNPAAEVSPQGDAAHTAAYPSSPRRVGVNGGRSRSHSPQEQAGGSSPSQRKPQTSSGVAAEDADSARELLFSPGGDDPVGLMERHDVVRQLEEEIFEQIARHRTEVNPPERHFSSGGSLSATEESTSVEAPRRGSKSPCPEAAPELSDGPMSRSSPGPPSEEALLGPSPARRPPCTALSPSSLSTPASAAASASSRGAVASASPPPPAPLQAEVVARRSSTGSSTAGGNGTLTAAAHRRSVNDPLLPPEHHEPLEAAFPPRRQSVQQPTAECTPEPVLSDERPLKPMPSGGALVSLSFFDHEEDDGAKEMRRRKVAQQIEKRRQSREETRLAQAKARDGEKQLRRLKPGEEAETPRSASNAAAAPAAGGRAVGAAQSLRPQNHASRGLQPQRRPSERVALPARGGTSPSAHAEASLGASPSSGGGEPALSSVPTLHGRFASLRDEMKRQRSSVTEGTTTASAASILSDIQQQSLSQLQQQQTLGASGGRASGFAFGGGGKRASAGGANGVGLVACPS